MKKKYSFINMAILFAVLFLSATNKINAQSGAFISRLFTSGFNAAAIDTNSTASRFLTDLNATTSIDATPPIVVAFDFSPRTINTSESQTVTVTLRVTDESDGFQSGFVSFHQSPGNYGRGYNFNSSNRISGDNRDGVYQVQMTLPTDPRAAGTWKVESLALTDSNNTRNYFLTELSNLGFPTVLQVTHNFDGTPPVLQSFSLSPVSINTSNGPQTVIATARITDQGSGFNDGGGGGIGFFSPAGQLEILRTFTGSRISGNANDGIYQVNIVFPQNSQTGVWHIFSVSLNDFDRNNAIYSASQLASLGFPTDVQVTSTPASVSVGGRVIDANGRAVRGARVSITNSQGVTRMAMTNPFGYYRFANAVIGETYVFNVTAKRNQFNSITYTVSTQPTGIDFTANN